jgi:hypothetical protein
MSGVEPQSPRSSTMEETSKFMLGDQTQTFQLPLNDLQPRSDSRSSFHRFLQLPVITSSGDTPSQTSSPTSRKPRRKLRFHDTVNVTAIPSRHQYSDRIKQVIWTNRMELREMTQRNYHEFEYEHFDWNQVIMEEHMYLDSVTGSLVHPCHIQGMEECFPMPGRGSKPLLSRSDSLSLAA